MMDTVSNLPVVSGQVVRMHASVLHEDDQEALLRAVKALEHTSLATRLSNVIGRQLGTITKFIPIGVSSIVNRAAEKAIETALSVALKSLPVRQSRDSRLFHKAAAALSGAVGGVFGLSSLAVELPVSTVIIMRSIADIARREGEDLGDPEVGFACLQVFALGAHDKDAELTESGYFAIRGLLAKTISEAGRYVMAQGLGDETAPVLVRVIAQISSRFGIVVSEKVAAQAVPIIGAAGGAAVNYAFTAHFQSIAQGHFTVRRLERVYGSDVVKQEYSRLLSSQAATGFA